MTILLSRRGLFTGLAISSLVALISVVLVLTAGPAIAKEFATLHPIEGTVEVQKRGGGTFAAGSEGDSLREGDVVRTGSDGRAEIEYFDGSVTRMDFDTTYALQELASIPEDPGSKIISGEQTSGRTFNRVVGLTGSESRFETETPTATASVLGTEYVVIVNPDGTSDYWVLDGEVVLTTPDGEEVIVSAGQGITINEDGSFGGTFELTEEQLEDGFVLFNQCELDGLVENCEVEVEGEVITTEPSPEPSETPTPEPSPTDESTPDPTPTDPTPTEEPPADDPPDDSTPVDTTPPETILTESPSGTVAQSSSLFRFTSTEDGSSFACSVDGAAFASCTSPLTVGPLGDGPHEFDVRATDPAGNVDATPAHRSWTIDTTPPDTTITEGPGEEDRSAGRASTAMGPLPTADVTFAFESSEPGSTFECALGEAPFEACSSPLDVLGLLDGEHHFEVRALDAVANMDQSPASRDWNIDLIAPETTITDGPEGVVGFDSATFYFSADESDSTFLCVLDGEIFGACPEEIGFRFAFGESVTNGSAEYFELPEGVHTFEVYATDAAGNVDLSPATRTWTFDNGPPETTITSGPEGIVAETSATFEFESSEDGTFLCSQDAAAFAPCSSGIEYTGLATGIHSFQVYAVDGMGNEDESPATRSWRIGNPDAISVVLSWSSGPPDLDLHASSSGGHVYYADRCLESSAGGCWASLDQDITGGPPGVETITIDTTKPEAINQSYTIYVDNFGCVPGGPKTFAASGASVDIFGGGASSTLNPGSATAKQWNVAGLSVDIVGDATVSPTGTFQGTDPCGRNREAERSEARDSEPPVVTGVLGEAPAAVASVDGEVEGSKVHVTWSPATAAEVRFDGDAFPREITDGELGCHGQGECWFQASEGNWYVTVFPEGVTSVEPVEGQNAVTFEVEAGEQDPQEGDDPPAGGPHDPPEGTGPEDEEEPEPPPPDDDDPAGSDEPPPPEPEPVTPEPEPELAGGDTPLEEAPATP